MNIDIQDTLMMVDLPTECSIAKAEATADRLRSLSGNLTRITVRAETVQEIDTAYFQVLVALKAFADRQRIPFTMDPSPAVSRMCRLYGIDLTETSNEKSQI